MVKKIPKRVLKACKHTKSFSAKSYPTIKTNSWSLKNQIRRKNPSIFNFNKDSYFIYEPRYYSLFEKNHEVKKIMKPSNQQILLLTQVIKNLEEEYLESKNPTKIDILKIYKDYIYHMEPIAPILDERALRIKAIIKVMNKSMNISCRRISKKYREIYNDKISHTTVNRILKKQLNYHFIKSSIKTDKLIKNDSIKQTFFFIYVFLRCLKLGLNFIWIDESSIETKNNNFRNWVLKNEDTYHQIIDREKRNLLMAVSKDKTIYFEINKNNTNSNVFKTFFKNLLNKLNDKEKNESLFILDNLSSHSTPEMFELYSSKKIKILFGVPYFSKLNMIELCFRGIKNILYKNIFKSISEVEEKVKTIINDIDFISSYKFFYKETLNNYLNFINHNKFTF